MSTLTDSQRRYNALRAAGYTGVINTYGWPDDPSINYLKWFRIAAAASADVERRRARRIAAQANGGE
jgi:hypothetical protein